MTTETGAVPEPAVQPPDHLPDSERQRLTAMQGLAALSLDALSSVAYGPEAILVVLVAAGAAGLDYTIPVTIAICVLLGALVLSYRQVIAAFPNGGGAYAVSKAHLGRNASLIAAASLIVDYVLNAAVGVLKASHPRHAAVKRGVKFGRGLDWRSQQPEKSRVRPETCCMKRAWRISPALYFLVAYREDRRLKALSLLKCY